MIDMTQIKTPCFVLDQCLLEEQLDSLGNAINKYWNNTVVGYSVKTNSLPFLAPFFKNKGILAETVSEDEYELVTTCEYNRNEIICNGPIKSKEFVFRALDGNSILNIDSHTEVEHVINYKQQHEEKNIGVGIRVNLDVREIEKDNIGGRFGFSYEAGDLQCTIERLHKNGVKVTGLHLHTGCLSGTLEKYKWLTSKFARIVEEYSLKDEIQYIDYGGGFYGFMENKPKWEDYFKTISSGLQSAGFSSDNLLVIIEPGASILAGVFSYYTRITDIRNNTRESFAFCDGSRIHIDPLMHKQKQSYTYHIIRASENSQQKLNLPQTLAGYTCMENDRIMKLENNEILDVNDIVVFEKVGSYTMTLSPLFISYYPPVYLKRSGEDLICIREKWTSNEVVQKSILTI